MKYSSTSWIIFIFSIPLSYLRFHVEYHKDKELCLYILIPILIGFHILFLYLCKSVKILGNEVKVTCLLGMHRKIFEKKDIIFAREEEAGRGLRYLVIRDSKGQICKIHPFAVRHYDKLLFRLSEWLNS